MPLDLGIASSVASAVPGPMDFFNATSDLMANIQQQRFSKQMYEKQRADNIEFWNMQNAYNSPEAQMQRFTDAGLNSHLIYGRGESGNAGNIPTPDVQPVNFRAPKFEGNPSLMANLLGDADLKIKNAQANNLNESTEVIRQNALLTRLKAEREGFDLQLEKDMRDNSSDYRREQTRRLRLESDVMMNRDAREAALNSSNLKEAAERMLTMQEQRKGMPIERTKARQEIRNMIKSGELMEMDKRLREKGINPSDPMWARYVGMLLSDLYEGRVTAGDIGTGIWKWLFGK